LAISGGATWLTRVKIYNRLQDYVGSHQEADDRHP
jgi:hypothetical protein